jgi:hypothetical protein
MDAVKQQLMDFNSKGKVPLMADPLTNKIDQLIKNPELSKDELAVKTLEKAKDYINGLAEKNNELNGNNFNTINATALKNFRQGITDRLSSMVYPNGSTQEQRNVIAKLSKDLKPILTEALNNASGGDLLSKADEIYRKESIPVDQKKVMHYLRNLTESSEPGGELKISKLSEALKDNNTKDTLEKAGVHESRKDFSFLTPKQLESIKKAKDTITRNQAIENFGKEGAKIASDILKVDVAQIPHFFSATVTLVNKILRTGSQQIHARNVKELAKTFENPYQVAILMKAAKDISDRKLISDARRVFTNPKVTQSISAAGNETREELRKNRRDQMDKLDIQ